MQQVLSSHSYRITLRERYKENISKMMAMRHHKRYRPSEEGERMKEKMFAGYPDVVNVD